MDTHVLHTIPQNTSTAAKELWISRIKMSLSTRRLPRDRLQGILLGGAPPTVGKRKRLFLTKEREANVTIKVHDISFGETRPIGFSLAIEPSRNVHINTGSL